MSINIIGITGPSGAGKSLICTYLAKKNIPVINADEVYHSMLTKGYACTLALTDEFGEDILSQDGTPDRKKLGDIVFSSDEKLQKLNSIVLKFVIDKINEIIRDFETAGSKNIVLDAPTLIESGFAKKCHTVISVLAPKEERIIRICERDNISRKAALLRVNAQRNDDFYIKNSDYILMNSSDLSSLHNEAGILFGNLLKV